jgi:hypothetical protein
LRTAITRCLGAKMEPRDGVSRAVSVRRRWFAPAIPALAE